MRIVLAVNPAAGSGGGASAARRASHALTRAGHSIEVLNASGFAELRGKVAAAVNQGPDALVVVGGDGMVHLGVNATAGTPVPLGIIPAGTGNDAARSLGLPVRRPERAAAHLLRMIEGKPRVMDLGRITGEDGLDTWFASACSAGLDGVVNARANSWSWPRGSIRYVFALLRELPFFRPPSYELVIDGQRVIKRATVLCVSNMRSIGGGMKVTPDAVMDDGRLDLLCVDPMPRLRLLALFPLIFLGKHVGLKEVQLQQVSEVTIESPVLELFADGEHVGRSPATIRVHPAALRVWA